MTLRNLYTLIVVPGLFFTFSCGAFAEILSLDDALSVARNACAGIGDDLSDLKRMAGINTAVTAVGTVSGGVALGTGIAKSRTDKEQQELKDKVAKLIAEKSDVPIEHLEIADESAFREQILSVIQNDGLDELSEDMKRIEELEQKSKNLGNIRTGTLAVSTATNVAGTVIAARNKVDEDLETRINNCISAVKDLSNAKLAAKMEGVATEEEISQADKIIANCRDWDTVDLKTINKRAKGAAISSGIGAGTGIVGTITSAVANTDATRNGDEQKEKKLNTTANVMAGASTAASAMATIFNATQISAIKKAATVADACEEALQ